MSYNSWDKRDDDRDEGVVIPFQQLDKGQVIQDVKMFGSARTKTRESYYLLTKILYLIIAQSESFSTEEATNVFFAVTKLFQSKDIALRRMMYLLLKELSPFAEDTIIAFAILIKDVNSDVEMYQANAIRVISGIMDTGMLGQMERYLKQAIVSRDVYVASSALVSSYHLALQGSVDVIRRWVSEVTEALKSGYLMVQYHALGLLHLIKQADRLAVSKLVLSYASGGALRSPYAHTLLIRFSCDVLAESKERDPSLYRYLERCLRHKSDTVVLEAARGLANLKDCTEDDLAAPVSVLQLFLNSPKATLRFAACRTLNKIANKFPDALGGGVTYELENLITDSNRNIATLAITTLLKVESEHRVERLMKQIGAFISDIGDEFKTVVVDAIRTLAEKFPSKHHAILSFLSGMLRDSGGVEYKSAIVSTILTVLDRTPSAKEAGLEHLCEFIEDCEHTRLSKQILYLLGEEGPKTSKPHRYIRFIYNRVILEKPTVRAAAVTALAKFANDIDSLRAPVTVLLQRCLQDPDDEVRDRATLYLALLEKSTRAEAKQLLHNPLEVPIENLEAALVGYLDAGPSESPFLITAVPREVRKTKKKGEKAIGGRGSAGAVVDEQAEAEEAANFAKQMAELQSLFGELGQSLHATPPVDLTEEESAYQVTVVKHFFPAHLVLQYTVVNTLNEQELRNVSMDIGSDEDAGYTVTKVTPAAVCLLKTPSSVYVTLTRPQSDDVSLPKQTFYNNLTFDVHDVNTQTGEVDETGFPDEFPLDDTVISLSNFIRPKVMSNIESLWTSSEGTPQAVATFGLSSVPSLDAAVRDISTMLGMVAIDNSDAVGAGKTKHILYLSGTFIDGGIDVLARVRMKQSKSGVGMELTVRSASDTLSQILSQVAFNS